MIAPKYARSDFDHSPLVVFYEVTQACDLACQHCRACALPQRDPQELDSEQSQNLLAELARFPKPPLLVLTGGDPLKRPDVCDLVEHGVELGLEVAMTPSATPLVTAEALRRLRGAGLHRLAVSLDGVNAATHDMFRGVSGSYQRTLEILVDARRAGLQLQVNTTVTAANVGQIDAMADFLATQRIVLWSVFFLVPVGRGEQLERITPQQYEEVFERLWHHARHHSYGIKTTEAPHYRRYVLQRNGNPQRSPSASAGHSPQRAPLGINDGKGIVFVNHRGVIYPSGFLPIACGRFPRDSLVEVYQNSRWFRKLRDVNQLGGKCGQCEFRHACGGSRARSYAVTGDVLAAEPDCMYLPSVRWQPDEQPLG